MHSTPPCLGILSGHEIWNHSYKFTCHFCVIESTLLARRDVVAAVDVYDIWREGRSTFLTFDVFDIRRFRHSTFSTFSTFSMFDVSSLRSCFSRQRSRPEANFWSKSPVPIFLRNAAEVSLWDWHQLKRRLQKDSETWILHFLIFVQLTLPVMGTCH